MGIRNGLLTIARFKKALPVSFTFKKKNTSGSISATESDA